jgi:nucleoside 2-deoxyribosyltransferase
MRRKNHHSILPATLCRGGIYFADNARLWPSADAEVHRQEVEAMGRCRGFRSIWPSEHFLLPDLLHPNERRDPEVVLLLPRAPLLNISNADAVVADVSPFRGPSLNPVIALEIGIALSLGLPIFAWAEPIGRRRNIDPWKSFFPSIIDKVPGAVTEEFMGSWYEIPPAVKVENFGLIESATISGNLTSLSKSLDEAVAACVDHFDRLRSKLNAAPVS